MSLGDLKADKINNALKTRKECQLLIPFRNAAYVSRKSLVNNFERWKKFSTVFLLSRSLAILLNVVATFESCHIIYLKINAMINSEKLLHFNLYLCLKKSHDNGDFDSLCLNSSLQKFNENFSFLANASVSSPRIHVIKSKRSLTYHIQQYSKSLRKKSRYSRESLEKNAYSLILLELSFQNDWCDVPFLKIVKNVSKITLDHLFAATQAFLVAPRDTFLVPCP